LCKINLQNDIEAGEFTAAPCNLWDGRNYLTELRDQAAELCKAASVVSVESIKDVNQPVMRCYID
jgi:hypothetical protein